MNFLCFRYYRLRPDIDEFAGILAEPLLVEAEIEVPAIIPEPEQQEMIIETEEQDVPAVRRKRSERN